MKKFFAILLSIALILSTLTINAFATDYTSSTLSSKSAEGLKNPDGTVVYGINYTPAYLWGWFASAVNEAEFRPDTIKSELKDIVDMGFNSIRILPPVYPTLITETSDDEFNTALAGYKGRLSTVFKFCQELGLTIDAVMCWSGSNISDADYMVSGSRTERIIKMFLDLGATYNDVVVLWEIENEPDFEIKDPSKAEEVISSTEWTNKKVFFTWAKGIIDDYYSENTSARKIPVSIGTIDSAEYDSWDSQNMDVLNMHIYSSTVSATEEELLLAVNLDRENNVNRPIVISEFAAANTRQPASDIINWCKHNGLACYFWGYGSTANEQDKQGIVDNLGKIRPSTLPLSVITDAARLSSQTVAAYDLTLGGIASVGYYYLAEDFYNWARLIVPYYTEDYKDVYENAPGNNDEEKNNYIFALAAKMALPYIRTYGTYTNDNANGGTGNAGYYENDTKYNTGIKGTNVFRARYAFSEGVNGSDAIIMQEDNELAMLNATSDGSVEVKIKLADNSQAGLVIKSENETSTSATSGLYIYVSGGNSDEVSANKILKNTYPAYKLKVYEIDANGIRKNENWHDISASDFDADGYLTLKAQYTGAGTENSPLNCNVFVNNIEKAQATVTGLSDKNTCVTLINAITSVAYFDDVIFRNSQNEIVFSDSFENGKFDNDLVTYNISKAYNNNSWSDSVVDNVGMVHYLNDMITTYSSETVSLSTPTITNYNLTNNNLTISWIYSGTGENGFEIQRSNDQTNWETYWRTAPDKNSAIIPVGDEANEYFYRVSPVSSDNKASYPSNAISLKQVKPYAQYTFDNTSNIGLDYVGNKNLQIDVSATTVSSSILSENGKELKTAYFAANSWSDSLRIYDNYVKNFPALTISVRAKSDGSIETEPAALFSNGVHDTNGGFMFGLFKDNEFFYSVAYGEECIWEGFRIDQVLGDESFKTTNGFHDYAMTFSNDRKTVCVYVDGTLVFTRTYSASVNFDAQNSFDNRLVLGQVVWQGGNMFKGWMDSVTIYNESLSATQISALHDDKVVLNNKDGELTLLSSYSFDDSTDLGKDYVGNNNLQINGTGATQVNGKHGNAVSLDGATNMSVNAFQDLESYTISYFGSSSNTEDIWNTIVQNGAKLRVFLRHNNWNIIQDQDGSWLNNTDLGYLGVSSKDLHHYVITLSKSDNSISTYVDGVLRTVSYNYSELDATNNWNVFSIGGVCDLGGYHNECIPVTIDELNVYSGSMAASEVSSLYNSYDADYQYVKSPIAYYNFDDSLSIGKDQNAQNSLNCDDNTGLGVKSLASEISGNTMSLRGEQWFDGIYTNDNYIKDFTNFTVSVKAKMCGTVVDANMSLVSTGWSDVGGFTLGIQNYEGLRAYFCARTENGETVWLASPNMDDLMYKWHSYSVSVTNGGKTIKLYVDGEVVASANYSSKLVLTNTNSTNLVIGGMWYRTPGFKGEIEDLAVYDCGMTDNEVADAFSIGNVIYRGDANEDKSIDLRDLVRLKKKFVYGTDYKAFYDCNADGVINALDLSKLIMYLVGVYEYL